MPYDVAIMGGGPAGAAAAVYAARKRLKTVLITDEWGGQSNVSPIIQNWIGDISISGADLAKKLRAHVESYAGPWLTLITGDRVLSVEDGNPLSLTLRSGKTISTKTILIASGANRRRLDVPGADTFDQKGLTYCASCDGPLFADQDVAVIGGGNAAFETALQLLAYCKSVTMVNRSDSYRADEVTVEKVLANPKLRAIKNASILEVTGEKFVNGLRYKDSTGEHLLSVAGIFVEIGLVPNTDWLGSLVALDATKHVVADPRTQRTSHPRIWAAGDVTDATYHQNNIAAGDAVKALEDMYVYLHTKHA
jgi:alkyl hydroperoxide reductase subunit F